MCRFVLLRQPINLPKQYEVFAFILSLAVNFNGVILSVTLVLLKVMFCCSDLKEICCTSHNEARKNR